MDDLPYGLFLVVGVSSALYVIFSVSVILDIWDDMTDPRGRITSLKLNQLIVLLTIFLPVTIVLGILLIIKRLAEILWWRLDIEILKEDQ